MYIDIPMIWDYLGEVLAPVFARTEISLVLFKNSPECLVSDGVCELVGASE